MKCYIHILIIYLTLNLSLVYGQTGREFWIGIPDVSNSLGDVPVYLHITALFETDVTISLPADPGFTPINIHLVEMEHRRIDLSTYLTLSGYWETIPDGSGSGLPQNKGFLITSAPGEISVYYELDNSPQNRDIISLKGKSALGTDFTVSTQNWFDNYRPGTGNEPRNGFLIVATKDNTNITVYPNGTELSGYFPVPASINLTLNRGQTYAFKISDALYKGEDHINGIDVSSDKDISITIYDDGIFKVPLYYDLFADQLIPNENLGTGYFLQRGISGDTLDAFVITGTVNGTSLFIDGAFETTINENEVYRYSLPVSNESATLTSSQPVLVTHMASTDAKIGAAVLPSFESCIGSYEVAYTRSFNVEDGVSIRLIGHNVTAGPSKNQTADNFYFIQGNAIMGFDTTKIPKGYFEYSYDSTYVYLPYNTTTRGFVSGIISHGKQVKIVNTLSKFHFGVINGGPATGAKYSYYSNYRDVPPSAGIGGFSYISDTVVCNLDDVRLAASGGNEYVWTSLSNPMHVNMLSDDSVAAPVFSPDSSGTYLFNVKISGLCHADTNVVLQVSCYQSPSSNFLVNTYSACSLDTILITNTSNTANTDKMIWTFSPPGNKANQDTLPGTFPWVFPANTSDSIQAYTITLNSYSAGEYCTDSRERIIFIKPGLEVGFTPGLLSGCAPFEVDFTNNTTCGHDTLIYLWTFGDGSFASQVDASHIFANNSTNDTVFNVKLTGETPFGCFDSDSIDITVLPRVEPVFSIDTNYSCSPLTVNLDPSGSLGADSIVWKFDLFYKDSTSGTTSLGISTLTHTDTSISSGPDTLGVYLVAYNDEGCIDSSSLSRLIVYPNISADIQIDKDEICDSDSILFTNMSSGYKPLYEWNFGDNNYRQDTTGISYVKKYINRSDSDTTFTIRLTASSEGICKSTDDTTITVHPFVKANFGFEYETNCSPLTAQISNTSIQVDSYFWDFGDGTSSSTSSSSFSKVFSNPLPFDDTTYTIKLIASNIEGCADSLSRNITLSPEVVSSFNILDTSICSPDSVHFQNNSTGKNLSYSWNFGNGLTGTDSEVEFAKYYTNYTDKDSIVDITLIASNGNYCADTSTQSVEILAFIDAEFTIPNVDSCAPFTIRLINYSSQGAHVFNWDLGPAGASSDFEPIMPAFNNPTTVEDTITIKLSAASDASHWGICSDEDSVQVIVYPLLNAGFTLDTNVSCNPLITPVTNSTTPTDGTLYEWYLDNTPFSTKEKPDDLYIENFKADSLVQTLWLYGNSKHGCRDTASRQVIVYPRVSPQFTVDKEALCTYDSIYLDRSSSEGGIVSFEWDFNGEETYFSSDSIFYYSSFDNPTGNVPVQKTITLTASDVKGCSKTWQENIQVYPRITADFSLDTQQACYGHVSVFTNNSTEADYYWEYGDGLDSRLSNPNHTYSNFSTIVDSTYYPMLIARSQYDCYDTARSEIVINAKPKANFYFPITADCPPFEAQMVNNSDGNNLAFNWDFAGEGSDIIEDPVFLFSNTSNIVVEKPVKLNVVSMNGCTDSLTKTLTVYPNVDTNFTYSASEGCSPLTVDFESIADETNIQQILWFVDDEAFSNLADPTYVFDNPLPENAVYNVNFKVYSIYNCIDSAQVAVTVYPSPEVDFIPDPVTVGYNTDLDQTPITFRNETQHQDIWEYQWQYGDGNSDNNGERQFTYNYGDHFWGNVDNDFKIPITLTGWNKDYALCRDSISYEIIISAPEPEINIFENVADCQPFTVDFDAYTKYNNEGEYFWEFGIEGETSTEENPTYTFTEPGSYTVRLTIKGDGGQVSDYKIVEVIPKPIVNFSFNDTIVFVEEDEITFYNYTEGGTTYEWYFNADDIAARIPESEEFSPVYSYSDTGTFRVGLIAKSVEECEDTLINPQPILVLEKGVLEFPTAFYASEGRISDEFSTNQGEGEGNNYLFYPRHVGISEYHIEIYSRWGTKIFETDNIDQGWNGMFDGTLSAQDVYIWRATGRFANGQPFDKSGDVTLLRGTPQE